MNRKKNGTKKKRIRARALDPYKRVNVCLPFDAYRHLERIAQAQKIAVGSVARHVLCFATDWEKADKEERERMLKSIGLSLPSAVYYADALPMQGEKRVKKASKTAKMPDLVK